MCDVIAYIFWLWIILVLLRRLRASARNLIVHAIMNFLPFHRCDYGSRVTVHVYIAPEFVVLYNDAFLHIPT